MPIPLIILAGAGLVGAYGLAKCAIGVRDVLKAKSIGAEADSRHKAAMAELESRRVEVNTKAQAYGSLVLRTRRATLGRFVRFVEQLGQRASQKTLKALREIDIDIPKLDEFKTASLEAAKILGGAIGSVSAGASAGAGALTAVGLWGTASTGTAISTLSGAAEHNAILAWLGGGALAAGGGGMALGTIVLGGIIFAPAALVTGFVLAGQGKKALTKARKYEADVNVDIQKMEGLKAFMGSLLTRIKEMRSLVTRLDQRANQAMNNLEAVDFDPHDDEHVSLFQQAALLIYALADIMRTPILDSDGNLTVASHSIQARYDYLVD